MVIKRLDKITNQAKGAVLCTYKAAVVIRSVIFSVSVVIALSVVSTMYIKHFNNI